MAPAPRDSRKQKRPIVESSDEDTASQGHRESTESQSSHGASSQSHQTQNTILSRLRNPRTALGNPPSTSTDRSEKPASKKRKYFEDEKGKNTSIHQFFKPGSTKQSHAPLSRAAGQVQSLEEDSITDDISDSEIYFGQGCHRTSALPVEETRTEPSSDSKGPSHRPAFVSASRKFTTARSDAKTGRLPKPISDKPDEDTRPWSEKFVPSRIEELAVHKKKVADVQAWLKSVFEGTNNKRLLVLRGPSGCGKTSTLRLLADELEIEITEWKNPVGMGYNADGYVSMAAQLEDFIGRSKTFPSLDLDGGADFRSHDPTPTNPTRSRRKAIVLEDFPNTLYGGTEALRSFRLIVLQYLVANVPVHSAGGATIESETKPLILIISETRANNIGSVLDSFTAHRLLGPDLVHHPGTSIIEFNPIAKTILIKALELVAQKEARQSGRRRIPRLELLSKVTEVGDIRSAIGSLEFITMRNNLSDTNTRPSGSSRKARASESLRTTDPSIEMITQRQCALDIFHAVGKVVYNKRKDSLEANSPLSKTTEPPEHLRHKSRPTLSEVSVESLLDESSCDVTTFVAALHENYPPSCNGENAIDNLNGCMEALSDSDLLNPETVRAGSSTSFSSGRRAGNFGVDSLCQSEICFQVAVRGILFSLPHPVKRSVAIPGGKGSNAAFKLFFPQSLRLWRRVEEVEGLVARWIHSKQIDLALRSPVHRMEQTDSSLNRNQRPTDKSMSVGNPVAYEQSAPASLSNRIVKKEALLEWLPYVARIQQQEDPVWLGELKSMVEFDGLGSLVDVSADEAEDEAVSPLESRPRGAVIQHTSRAAPTTLPTSGDSADAMGQLTLSDDDIVDDW